MKKLGGLSAVVLGFFYINAASAQLGLVPLEPLPDDEVTWDVCAVDPTAEGCAGALPDGANASDQGRENAVDGRTRASEAHDANEGRKSGE